ncbi:unnamed protein product [Sphenostylis stenocarpa]|uniref:Uncharacterized protein n=1 Tax=Sphenostylis stenocarpa TaxID=92480 RepID=A0AA86VCR2_9FABA|nr:unnamed protein product [Sphenostylis stenocarpa]
MVLRGSEESRGAKSMSPATPNRSNPLHNFSLSFLKWGTQRRMRCATATETGARGRGSSASNSDESTATWSEAPEGARGEKRRLVSDDEGIAVVRQRLILDLKTEADRMKDAILRSEEEAVRPWNLRKRRAKVEAPALAPAGGGGKVLIDDKKRNHSLAAKLPQLRSGSDKTEKAKFALELSKKEIEEDFMAMLGQRPPRRPSKRPRVQQKMLDTLLPGLWLTEVTPELYKVTEAADNGKVRHSGKRKVDAGF